MALISWTETLSVKVHKMDDDHHVLVDMLNDLHDAMKAGKANSQMLQMVNGLKQYTKQHFDAEEQLMKRHDYPGFVAQNAEHKRFLDRVSEFEQKLSTGQAVASAEVLRFLCDWIQDHIKGYDQQYSQFFNTRGVS